MMQFADQVVLITGASNGIGRQLALDLAARGAVVAGCGRSIARLREVLVEVRRTSPRSVMIGCDVGDAEQVRGMTAKVLADYGRIDILVNNAGIGMRQAFAEMPAAAVEEIMRTNFIGAVNCTREALPSMIARGSGRVVNVSSGAGKIGTLNMAAYCASKFALNGWAESLYYELKPLGVKVTIVCPGPVRTEFNRDFRESEPKAPAHLVITAEAVSQAIIRAIEKDKFEVIVPRWLALLSLAQRLAPVLFRFFAERKFRPYVRRPAASEDEFHRTGTDGGH
jgi:short-subunit dehydrogenase